MSGDYEGDSPHNSELFCTLHDFDIPVGKRPAYNYLNLEPNSVLKLTQSSSSMVLPGTKISKNTFTMYTRGKLNCFDKRVP